MLTIKVKECPEKFVNRLLVWSSNDRDMDAPYYVDSSKIMHFSDDVIKRVILRKIRSQTPYFCMFIKNPDGTINSHGEVVEGGMVNIKYENSNY